MFVGEGWLALVPLYLPRLRQLRLAGCDSVCDKYVEKLLAAVPELEVTGPGGDIVNTSTMRNRRLETSYECCTLHADLDIT